MRLFTPVSDDHGLEGYDGRAFTSLPNQKPRSPSEDSRLPRWCLGSWWTFLLLFCTSSDTTSIQGQFSIVIEDEISKIRASFRKFDTPQGPYRPKLTVVVCGKRHHTRFYPTEPNSADHNGNPKPGTIVDRGVTAIYEYDFFLQAHGGLQGTTRPTHYYVLCNEMDLNADDLQSLTNAISYTFARATKAVSLAAPAYYADLACERGRCYLHKLLMGFSDTNTTTASGSINEEDVFKEAEKLWNGGVKGKLKETMYYL